MKAKREIKYLDCETIGENIDTSRIPRPAFVRRIWMPGMQYEDETVEQMEAREKAYRAEDERINAEAEKLWRWKTTPLWET